MRACTSPLQVTALFLLDTNKDVKNRLLGFSERVECVSAMKRCYAEVAPEKQRAVVKEYKPGVRGYGITSLAKKHGLNHTTVQHILERSKEHGDPVQPRGHKQRKLDSKQEAQLLHTLDTNPLATNRDLARAVGYAIAKQTVSDYVARADPPFTRKRVQDQEPEELTEDWKSESRKYLGRIKNIPLDTRNYADETGIFENDALMYGRSRKGKPIFRPRPRWARKYTLHVYAKRSGVVHWDLSKKNANTEEVERVARDAAKKNESG